MSQRFTVSKSGGGGASDIQGEVNQLFEGDEPTTSCCCETDKEEVAANAEVVVVVLKGRTDVDAWLSVSPVDGSLATALC